MSHKLLSAVSILPALLVMPALADVINLNEEYSTGGDYIKLQEEDGGRYIIELSTKNLLNDSKTASLTTPEIELSGGTKAAGVKVNGVSLVLGDDNTSKISVKSANSSGAISILSGGNLTVGGERTKNVDIQGPGNSVKGLNVKQSTAIINGENINIVSEKSNGINLLSGAKLNIGTDSTQKVKIESGASSALVASGTSGVNVAEIKGAQIDIVATGADVINVHSGGSLKLSGTEINITGDKDKKAISADKKSTSNQTDISITGKNLNVTGAVSALSKGSITANVTESITINADNEAVVSGITIIGKNAKPGDSSVNLSANKIDITSNSSYGIHATGLADKKQTDTHTIDLVGNDISIIAKGDIIENEDPAKIFIPSAVYADRGGCVTIKKAGDDDAKSVVNIKSDNGYGVFAQNATSAADNPGLISSVDINADEINIFGGHSGIIAMSQGIINLTGDTTIYGGTSAISARGDAKVNINTDGVHTTKIDGDINFGYNDSTSGTPVDALVNVVLAGADSYWNGNTIVSYDKKPADETKLDVSNVTVTLKDGATWNATKITDNKGGQNGLFYTALNNLNIDNGTVNIADTKRGIAIDNADIKNGTFTGGHVQINKTATIAASKFSRSIYNDGTVVISGGDTTMSGGILGDGDFTLSDGATLNLGTAIIQQKTAQIDGTVNAIILDGNSFARLYGDVRFGDNAELNLNVARAGTYKIFDTDNDFTAIKVGTLFDVQNNGADGVVISARAADDIAEESGLSNIAAATLVGLANGGNSVASINAQCALSRGDTDYIETESAKSAPADKPITHSVSTSVQNQVLSLVASRMAGVSTGRSGGDFVTTGAGMWAHGLINRSKMNNSFHGDTRGMAVGVDATFNRKYTFGMGYAYGDTDVHVGDNKTDIESNTLFAYAQYKPSNWFLNGAFNYTFADYSTGATLFGVSMTSEYDVDSYGAQLMTGYDFATGVTPMAGVRYLHISQDDYNNGIADVKSDDSDFMTGVAGLKYAFDINVYRDFVLQPELRAAATYDFMSDESIATVLMPGAATYVVNADRLSRFGGEFGIGMSALYRGVTVSLNYDLDLHKDYTSQTGMLKFRYNF